MGLLISAASVLLLTMLGGAQPTEFTVTFDFETNSSELEWYANNGDTSFSTNKWVSSTDLLAVRRDWTGPITLTGLSFNYQSYWTNEPNGSIGFRDQTDTLLQTNSGVSADTAWTGLSHTAMTSLYIGWNFFPNVWNTAYSLQKLTMTFTAYANPFA